MKTPISYYGGKQNLISEILPLMPKHTQYVEPFIGGGQYFLLRKNQNMNVLTTLMVG